MQISRHAEVETIKLFFKSGHLISGPSNPVLAKIDLKFCFSSNAVTSTKKFYETLQECLADMKDVCPVPGAWGREIVVVVVDLQLT